MSYQQERRFVLNMLETGTIDPDQATRLLDVLSLQPALNKGGDSFQTTDNKVSFEIDADQTNLRQVLAKLSKAFSPV